MNAAKILREHGISLPSYAAGRYYTMCPKCSAKRSKAHQNNEVLGVTIDDKGVQWGCNHCTWTGGAYYNGKANGHSHSAIVATYDYVDETGELLFQVCRKVDKSFPQRAPDGKGGWTWSTKDVHKVLYRLPEVIEAIASGHTILIPEGEKDANAAWKIGLPATCNPGGASEPGKKTKWRKEYSETLRDADVVIMPDHDAAGYAHADAVARSLSVIAKRVRILKLPDHWPEVEAKKGGDLSDGLAAGHTREQLDALIDAAPNYAAVQGNVSKGNEENADGEDAIALRFAEEHAENLRYVAMWSRWLSWNGKLWRFDDTLHAFDRARRICREAGESDAKTVAAVERLAKSDRRLAATIDQWDADPWRLNTPGGVVDLRTGKTHPARPRDYCTKITAVAPGGDCQTWLAFLHRVTGGNDELITFLRRVCGYALTGITREHALFFLYGTGANGKSVFISTIAGILGDYHTTAPIETFTASQSERHPTDLAGLRGARLVTAVETDEGRRWAESKIKALTGGDKISARFMRQDFFEFVPNFKLVIAGNHKPGLRSVDEAIRRRLHLIPFSVTILPAERDLDLAEKLKAEWPGILAWMIDGCLKWQATGLQPPAAVTDATAAYLAAEDATGAWMDECCERDPSAWAANSTLFASWTVWAAKAGEPIGSQKRFVQSLEARGLEPRREKSIRGFRGVRATCAT